MWLINIFDSTCCRVVDDCDACVLFGYRENNAYIIDMLNLVSNMIWLTTRKEDLGYGIGDWVMFLLIIFLISGLRT